MKKQMMVLACALAVGVGAGPMVSAQPPAPAPSPEAAPKAPPQSRVARPAPESVPLNLQIVLERFQGQKKTSSLPYTMSVFGMDEGRYPTQLRIGAQVPVPMAIANGEVTSAQYRDVGTSIDCWANLVSDGRFLLTMTIEDSWVESGEREGAYLGRPSFRSFKTNQQVTLRDGQSSQFTTATDKTNGEVVKVTVKLDVVK